MLSVILGGFPEASATPELFRKHRILSDEVNLSSGSNVTGRRPFHDSTAKIAEEQRRIESKTDQKDWWFQHCRRNIYRNWSKLPIDRFFDKCVTCSFSIDSDGAPALVKIDKSSGDAKLDDLVLEIVKKSGPLPPLPVEPLPNQRVSVTFGRPFHLDLKLLSQ